MSTRVKILETALKLFNREGLDRISIRDIAAEIGISDGNLRYHFRTKDDLIEALFNELADKIGMELVTGVDAPLDMQLMKHMLEQLLQGFYDYRFIMQDLVAVMNNHDNVRKEFNRITAERLVFLDFIIKRFIDSGYLIPDPYPGHYQRFMENMLIVSHFWINGARLFYKGPKKEIVAHYTETIFSLMYPYLTKKALKEMTAGA